MTSNPPEFLMRIRAFASRHRAILFWLALLVFAVGLAFSVWHLSLDWSNIAPSYLVIDVFVLGPMGLLLGSFQLFIYARSVPRPLSYRQAIEVCAGGTVGNLLPVPAGAVAHGSALVGAGLSLKYAGSIVAYSSVAWLGLGISVVGVYLVGAVDAILGILVLVPSIALVVFGSFFLGRLMPISDVCMLVIVQLFRIALLSLRFWIVLLALSEPAAIFDAMLFTGAAIGGMAISIVPSGLGVSEVLAALLAGLTTVSGAAGFAAMGLIRMSSIVTATTVLLVVTVPARVFGKAK